MASLFELNLPRSCCSILSSAKLQRSRPSGPRVTLLPNVQIAPQCSNVCRSPNRVPDSRCGLLLTQHGLSRPRRWCWVWSGRVHRSEAKSLDCHAILGQPPREAASSLHPTLVVEVADETDRIPCAGYLGYPFKNQEVNKFYRKPLRHLPMHTL